MTSITSMTTCTIHVFSQNNVSHVSRECSKRCFCANEVLVCKDYPCSMPNPCEVYACNPFTCEVSSNEGWCFCKNDGSVEDGEDCSLPTDCYDIFTNVSIESGIYFIKPTNWSGSPFKVYCNMSNGGGWTVSLY